MVRAVRSHCPGLLSHTESRKQLRIFVVALVLLTDSQVLD